MVDSPVSVGRRLDDSLRYYQHVRCNVFPRIRATLSALGAFGAAASPTPGLQATFAAVSTLCAASAVYTHYNRDAFGFSNAIWMQIARDNLNEARRTADLSSLQDVARAPAPELRRG